ncbi:MAG: glutamine--tRNA ligase/YqeY domain fusion protein [Clostridiales bacterium]|jgi:glutaminyl-tRNA synthetase|nr:glutamine--tRNA ligase/YqeY domain fusion protein [Clostridiales bacterium]
MPDERVNGGHETGSPGPGGISATGNFLHAAITEDLKGGLDRLRTRFPPEPNGYLHIGSAKAVNINFSLAKMYGGKCNLRFDDTNPVKEDVEYVNSIMEDIRWLGYDWEDRLYYASDYFEQLYEYAETLIKKGRAFVCDLSAEEVREYRGTLSAPGRESPYRNRSAEENLDLFRRMRAGEFPDASRTLRAKIDMASPNINMRDPVIYRIAHATHHNTGDKWCVYPMYDYAHPLEDAIERITHSLCSIEFEDHRPLYDWFINELDFEVKPRQIEFAKLRIANTIMGKRYLRAMVENGDVDGWDDPRMVTISGLRRRGYTPEALRGFLDSVGVSKADSVVDYSLLEYAAREDLKPRARVVMAVLDPLKVVITNYPEDKEEFLTIENHPENAEMGERQVPFSRELYIERDDFMENAPAKFFRLTPGRPGVPAPEVRLKGAYFIKCDEVIKDGAGNIAELRCSYDPETRSGSGFAGRKVKGTIHWVSARRAVPVTARLFDVLVFDDGSAPGGYRQNPNSMTVMENCLAEPSVAEAAPEDRLQFMRSGYFCLDSKLSTKGRMVFNRTVPLKSSYKRE